jgi:hypothetical protein
MSWDLNDDQYNSGGGANKIFNNGKAGVVENVRAEVSKKGADDKENAPDYKVTFYDGDDRSVNIAFWLGNDTSDWSEGKRRIYGARLKHLIHCFCGEDASIPQFKSYDDAITGTMKMIKDACTQVPVRVLTTYGSVGYEKDFPELRFAPPFVEPMSIALEETRLSPKD